MSGTNALFDDLGPKGQRSVQAVTIASALVVVIAIGYGLQRLYDAGQFEAELWTKLTREDTASLLFKGLIGTLKAAALAMVLALIVGALMALGRLAQNRPVRWLAGAYVEVFRAWPLLLAIYFAFLGLPYYGIKVDPFVALVTGLTLYNGAMLAEVFRSGILSLDRGQTEAASSLGLSYGQSMRYVVIPQAGRRMLPALVSQLIALIKDSSLGYVIGYNELVRTGRSVGDYSAFSGGSIIPTNILQTLVLVAAIFFVICFTLSRIAQRLEVRQHRHLKAGPIDPIAGPEDVVVTTGLPTR